MKLNEDLIRTISMKDINSGVKKIKNLISSKNFEIYIKKNKSQNLYFINMLLPKLLDNDIYVTTKNIYSSVYVGDKLLTIRDIINILYIDIISQVENSTVLKYYTVYDYRYLGKEKILQTLLSLSYEDKKNLPYARALIVDTPTFIKTLYPKVKGYLYIKWVGSEIVSFHDIDNSIVDNTNFMLNENLQEKLTLQQIRNKDIYTANGNEHLKHFYDIRKSLVGNPNKSVKFITSVFNNDGSADFLFQTLATPYEENNHEYKELESAPITNDMNQGKLVKNNSKEYIICIRIVDFFDKIDDLGVIDDGIFSKNDLSAILDLSENVKFSCNCASYYWMGSAYNSTQLEASLIPCDIKPKFWNDTNLRGDSLVCKHLSATFRNLGFFVPQMAMSIKKAMKEYGIL